MSRNLLGEETSPYLLQHKDNPVNWRGWNDVALKEARDQDKLADAGISSGSKVGRTISQMLPIIGRHGAVLGEREMRAGRSLDSVESGAPMLGFVTGGQERYFFELHRFCSPLGERVYASGKAANADKVREMSLRLRAEFGDRSKDSYSGADVLRSQQRVAWDLQ